MFRHYPGVGGCGVPALARGGLSQLLVRGADRLEPVHHSFGAGRAQSLKEVDPAEVAAYNAAQEAARGGSVTAPSPPPPSAGAAAGRGRSMPLGMLSISVSTSGARTYRGKMTMAQLVNTLSNPLSRPVLDQTGLKGTYEIELTYLADESDPMQMLMRSSMAASGGSGDAAHPAADAKDRK